MSMEKKLRGLSKRLEKTYEEVLKKYQEEYKALEDLGFKGNKERLAYAKTFDYFRRQAYAREAKGQRRVPEHFEGFLWGALPFRDRAQEIRERAKLYVKRHGKVAAMQEQLIDREGNILDTREKIFGRDNPNYLKPLDPNLKLYEKTLFGIFRAPNEDFKFTSFQTTNNALAAAWEKISMPKRCFVPCETWALRAGDGTMNKLSGSVAQDTKTVFRPIERDWDIEKIIRETMKEDFVPLDEVETHYEDFKDAWDRYIVVEGMIVNITPEWRSQWWGVPARLIDPEGETDATVRIYIPNFWKINFGEYTEAIILGKTRRSMRYDRETGTREAGDVVIDCHGIFPLPGLTTSPSESISEEEEEFEGWVE